MDEGRRARLDADAGGNDLEEAAVCYLQIVLADELQTVGARRLMRDMDGWATPFGLAARAAGSKRMPAMRATGSSTMAF